MQAVRVASRLYVRICSDTVRTTYEACQVCRIIFLLLILRKGSIGLR